MIKIISPKAISFILALTLGVFAHGSFAQKSYEYAEKIPSFSLEPKVIIFPVDFNELIPLNEQALIEPRLAAELRAEKYIPEKITLTPEDLAAYNEATDATTPDSANYRNLYGGLIKSLALKGDIIVVPSITVRVAEMTGRLAKGDGVTFNIPTELRPGEKRREDPFDQRKNNSAPTWSGNSKIYSLRLVAFTPDGEWLFTSYGGIAFPYYAVFSSGEHKQKESLFTEKADVVSLEKGIKKAFYPFRKKLKRSRK